MTGGATHLALAYALGARHQEDRTAAVDALLVLAGRDRLDGALLGRELAILVDRDLVKVNRTADALGTAADTGAHRTVLAVLAAMLPGLLAYEKTPGGSGPAVRGGRLRRALRDRGDRADSGAGGDGGTQGLVPDGPPGGPPARRVPGRAGLRRGPGRARPTPRQGGAAAPGPGRLTGRPGGRPHRGPAASVFPAAEPDRKRR